MAMIVILLEGGVGLPFFYGGHGGWPLFGQTGGYLVAFPAAAFISPARSRERLGQAFRYRSRSDGGWFSLVFLLTGWVWFAMITRILPRLRLLC